MQPRAVLRDVTYEIHRRSEAGWEITAVRYEAKSAIFDAQRIFEEVAGTLSVRVIRDVYDPITNTSRVNTVFRAVQPVPDDAAKSYWARRQARRGTGSGASPLGPQLADELMGGLLGKLLPAAAIEVLAPRPYVTRGFVVTILAGFGMIVGTVMGLLYR